MSLKIIVGDATKPIGEDKKFLVHVCNNRSGWGAGFTSAVSARWLEPEKHYRTKRPLRLGDCQFVIVDPTITVVNMICQDGYRSRNNPTPLNYDALTTCLRTVAHEAELQDCSIHMPRIGTGLGGADWARIEAIIRAELLEADVYVYDLS